MEAGLGKDTDLFKSFAGGGIGGILFLVVGHPFDTMKVRKLYLCRQTTQISIPTIYYYNLSGITWCSVMLAY